MVELRVLAAGKSPQAQAQARGRLFEDLMAKVLGQLGFAVDQCHNSHYAGLELDIEGHQHVTSDPLYAECKLYQDPIDAPAVHAFVGKFLTRWFKNNRSSGLVVAIPHLNGPAKSFLREGFPAPVSITTLEGPAVVDAIIAAKLVLPAVLTGFEGTVGEETLLWTAKGMFRAALLVPKGGAVPKFVAYFDATGQLLVDATSLEFIRSLDHERQEMMLFEPPTKNTTMLSIDVESNATETVAEVRGSSAPFEYQFPASPEFFVGRDELRAEILDFARRVKDGRASSRGFVLEGNSGWGKSSTLLAVCADLRKEGDFAISIDCRTATSAGFVMALARFVAKKYAEDVLAESTLDEAEIVVRERCQRPVVGFADAVSLLALIARHQERAGRCLVLVLDQFENVFFHKEALDRIRELFASVSDLQTSLILGFAWKSDLVTLTSEFPFATRNFIQSQSESLSLGQFTDLEIGRMLVQLENDLGSKLRKDLRHHLTDFSQGLPWLLKKLCAHVKRRRQEGVDQADMASGLLDIEQLFLEDLKGLSMLEEQALRKLAKAAPVPSHLVGEEFEASVVSSLVERRLVVRVGANLDIYWDIFRDFLNTGRTPPLEQYLPRQQCRPCLKEAMLLAPMPLPLEEFRKATGRSPHSFMNLLRELRLSGLVVVENDVVSLAPVTIGATPEETYRHLVVVVRSRLSKNRLAKIVTDRLQESGELDVEELARILQKACPYIEASDESWQTYARIFGDWLDTSGLALFKRSATKLRSRPAGANLDQDAFALHRTGRTMKTLTVGIKQVEQLANALAAAIQNQKPVDFSQMSPTTKVKTLQAMDDLGMIEREGRTIKLNARGLLFVRQPESRPALAREGLKEIPAYERFVSLTRLHSAKREVAEIGAELGQALDVEWSDTTARDVAKYMLNWARAVGEDIGVYSKKLSAQTANAG